MSFTECTDQRNKSEENEDKETSSKDNTSTLPSYTAMIAQAILNKSSHKCTLSEIYEFMDTAFPPLKEKGNGWRNCVRHTLSLSDCFVKLHRPESGRSCHWTVHPSYLPRFLRGDFRKRRQTRVRRNNTQGLSELVSSADRVASPFSISPSLYDRQGMTGSPMMPLPGTSTDLDPTRMNSQCSNMYSAYDHFPAMHSYQQDLPSVFQGMYSRDYRGSSSQFFQGR